MGFGAIAEAVAGGIGGLYNVFTSQRDFDYQKALQQQIFEREDTSVQRRVADLEAAGLNKNLATGSPAGAGSVVARSNTNDVNFGSILDALQHEQQIKNARVEGDILKAQKEKVERENALDQLTTLYSLGYDVVPSLDQYGKLSYAWKGRWIDGNLVNNFGSNRENNYILNMLDYQNTYNKNSADLIQKDNTWYTADKVSGLVLGSLGLLKPQFLGGKK